MEFPDKATYDAANKKMMEDPRMKKMMENMPFDGKRMIYGGFESIVDEAAGGSSGYADGYVLPVPNGNKEAYRELAAKAANVFKEYGATRVVEAWGDDVPDGQITDFKRAVKSKSGENVVFSFVEWPDKATRDAAWPKIMEDERMKPDQDKMPFDGQRMFWGGFEFDPRRVEAVRPWPPDNDLACPAAPSCRSSRQARRPARPYCCCTGHRTVANAPGGSSAQPGARRRADLAPWLKNRGH